MADGRAKNGGKREGAGRPTKKAEEDLHAFMTKAWPSERRERAFEAAARAAEEGDIQALKLLASYALGTPPSGDGLLIQQQVDDTIRAYRETLKEELPESLWQQIEPILNRQ